MFEYIRTHNRLMQGLLLLLIFPSFVFFGVSSLRDSVSNNSVASVAGQSISQQEFDQALRGKLDQIRQQYGPDFDAQLLNTPEQRKNILDDLVLRKVLTNEVNQVHLGVSDLALKKNLDEILQISDQMPNYKDTYRSMIKQRGMSVNGFEDAVSQDMKVMQLVNGVQNSALTSKTVLERIALITEQEREVQTLSFKSKDFANAAKPTEAMEKAYYEKNKAQFEVPEQISAEYVMLSADSLAEQVTVSDAEVAALYEKNREKKLYSTEEQRSASHILLSLQKDASAAETKAVKDKAESLLAQLKKNPESFAKLATENSQDPGSAAKAGDLGFFGRTTMVKPFADTAFTLKKGEISGLVQTDYGLHIIRLNEIKAAGDKSLDEVKPELMAELKKQKASKAYSEAAEIFTSMVYEQPDSLKPVADKLKLKIERLDNLHRLPNPALPKTMIANNEKFLKAIFSDEAAVKKHNTDATEIAPTTLVSARVLEHKAATVKKFEDVRSLITISLIQSQAQSLAQSAGEAKLKALKAADSAEGFSTAQTITRTKKVDIPNELLMAALKADVQKLPAFVGVKVADGFEIVRIGKVSPGTPDKTRRDGDARQINNIVANHDVSVFLEAVKQRTKVVVNEAQLNAKRPDNASP